MRAKSTLRIEHTPFQKWLVTFCLEKQIDMSVEVIAGDGTEIQVGDVLSVLMSAPDDEQAKAKNIFVMIDFKNGDVYHFIKHMAKALDKNVVKNIGGF